MNKQEAIKKLTAVMNKNYHKNDHICLKAFINDVEYFVLDKIIPKKEKALTVRGDSNLVEMLKSYPNINTKALMEWMEYKKYKSKGAVTKTLNMLNKYDHQTQQEMVDKSIMNEYKGLFEPKQQNMTFKQQDKQEENHKLDRALEHNVFDLIDQKAQQEQGVIDG